MTIGQQIRERRTSFGWSLETLAEMVHITKGFLSDLERLQCSHALGQ